MHLQTSLCSWLRSVDEVSAADWFEVSSAY